MTSIAPWRLEELQLARYMGGAMDINIVEQLPCKDFYDAQEYMYAQSAVDSTA